MVAIVRSCCSTRLIPITATGSRIWTKCRGHTWFAWPAAEYSFRPIGVGDAKRALTHVAPMIGLAATIRHGPSTATRQAGTGAAIGSKGLNLQPQFLRFSCREHPELDSDSSPCEARSPPEATAPGFPFVAKPAGTGTAAGSGYHQRSHRWRDTAVSGRRFGSRLERASRPHATRALSQSVAPAGQATVAAETAGLLLRLDR